MPAMFALGEKVIGNPTVATFAAFGSFAMLLLVDFTGPMRDRLRAQVTLAVVSAGFVCVATLASRTTWLAATAMALVAFAVLFAGVVSSVLASSTTTLLLAFILPVSLPGPVSSIPDRLAGWGMASGVSVIAIAFLWPAPVCNPLRGAAIAASRALAARLRAEVVYLLGGEPESAKTEHDAAVAVARADAALEALDAVFFATAYRPSGLSTAARAVVRVVDQLKWLNAIVAQAAPRPGGPAVSSRACAVKSAAASVLDRSVELLDEPAGGRGELHSALAHLDCALVDLERSATTDFPLGAAPPTDADDDETTGVISALDPSFRAQELSFVVAGIAGNVDLAAAAEQRSWLDQLVGRQPAGVVGRLSAARMGAAAHVRRQSSWLRSSMRGAVGLGLAVLVADLTGVQHAFWVVLGTLSVLRSSALNTGQSVVRGLAGTVAGFVAGAVLVTLIGTDTTLLWVLLPPAVLLAGLAPAAFSFAAGQAAFTLALLILFNILQPAGWRIGLVRIEDVALGGAVSLAVGLLFWPRGAGAALGNALADAYVGSASYLASAVEFGIDRCDVSAPARPAPAAEAVRAAAASQRLDDTFRSYLAERGAKPARLAEVTSLIAGEASLRLAADAVLELWQRGDSAGGDRAAARRELVATTMLMTDWYDALAASLAGTGTGAVPEPLMRDQLAERRLVAAVSHDLRGARGQATATAVRVIWTGDHLDAARRLQHALAGPARAAARSRP